MARATQKTDAENFASIDSEMQVIGKIMLRASDCENALERLEGDDFYVQAHRAIFETLKALHAEGKPCDIEYLSLRLKESPATEGLVLQACKCLDSTVHSGDCDEFAAEVREKSIKRRAKALFEDASDFNGANGLWRSMMRDKAARLLQISETPAFTGISEKYQIDYDSVEEEDFEYIWHRRLARGSYSLIAGESGVGKSTFVCGLAACLSQGWALPGQEGRPPMASLLFMKEDDPARSIKKKLRSFGANDLFVKGHDFRKHDFHLDASGFMVVEDYLRRLRPELVVFDPLGDFLPEGADINKASDVRPCLVEIIRLAEKYRFGAMILHHLSKPTGAGRSIHRFTGSQVIVSKSRSAFIAGEDQQTHERALLHLKSNLEGTTPNVGWKLGEDGSFWWTEATGITEGDFTGEGGTSDAPAFAAACEFLRDILSEGAAAQREIMKLARESDISTATLRRAKDHLGIRSTPDAKAGKSGVTGWRWMLPEGKGEKMN